MILGELRLIFMPTINGYMCFSVRRLFFEISNYRFTPSGFLFQCFHIICFISFFFVWFSGNLNSNGNSVLHHEIAKCICAYSNLFESLTVLSKRNVKSKKKKRIKNRHTQILKPRHKILCILKNVQPMSNYQFCLFTQKKRRKIKQKINTVRILCVHPNYSSLHSFMNTFNASDCIRIYLISIVALLNCIDPSHCIVLFVIHMLCVVNQQISHIKLGFPFLIIIRLCNAISSFNFIFYFC